MYSILGAMIGVSALWHILYAAIFILSFVAFWKTQDSVLSLFALLPREIVGGTYQYLRRIEKSEDKVRIERRLSLKSKASIV
jgi:uncharacterized protein YqhQ